MGKNIKAIELQNIGDIEVRNPRESKVLEVDKKRFSLKKLLRIILVILLFSVIIVIIVISVLVKKNLDTLKTAFQKIDGKEGTLEPNDFAGKLCHTPPGDYSSNVTTYLFDQMSRYLRWYKNGDPKSFGVRNNTEIKSIVKVKEGKRSEVIACLILKESTTNSMIVLFKGTTTTYEWLSVDFQVDQKGVGGGDRSRTALHMPRWLKARRRATNALDIRVHRGFLDYYDKIREQILACISENNDCNVYLCGHSLGAAMATLCTMDLLSGLRSKEPSRVWTVTAGCPRVGNAGLGAFFQQKCSKLFNLRNTADLVPTLPWATMPSLESDKLEKYVHAGKGLLFHHMDENLYYCHSLAAYQRNVSGDLVEFIEDSGAAASPS